MMSWAMLAFLANIFFAFSVIVDKTLNTKKIKSVYSFAVILNAIYLLFILVTTYIQRNTFLWGMSTLYSAIAGIIWFFMWIFFWKALQLGEASRISAIFFSQPIFTAFIGMLFLHESLNGIKWLGIVVIVAGAILSSLGGEHHKKEVRTAYLYALLAAIFSSVGNVISKYAMGGLPPLTVTCVAFYVTIPMYLYLLRDKAVLREVSSVFKNSKLLFQFSIRGSLGYCGIILNTIATGMGPISMIGAILGTQPIIILLISFFASLVFPTMIHEKVDKNALMPKLSALLLTVIGVILISLN